MSLKYRFCRCLALLALLLVSAASAQHPDYWLSGRDWSLEADPTYQVFYDLGAAPWISAHEQGGVAHLLFGFPPLILRYDMDSETWLDEISFADTPTAMAIDADGIYVAFASEVKRFALDGTGETALRTASFSVEEMVVGGGYLFLVSGDEIESVDKVTGDLIDSEDFFYSMRGLSIAPSINRLYARTVGVGPSDILVIEVASDGTILSQQDSPYHGDYPNAVKTWVFPDQTRVADNSGIVYNTTLNYAGSLAGAFDDLTFHASGPIALRGNELYAHGWGNFLEEGRFELDEAVSTIFAYEDSVYGFYPGAKGADVVVVPVSQIVPPDTGPPVDPEGLAYSPDRIIMGGDGVVYMLSKAHQSIFRWSTQSGGYLESIPLSDSPLHMAYSEINGRLYLTYLSGRITEIDITMQNVTEASFVNSPQQPCGLSTAGPWVFVCDPSGAWVSHFTYSPGGSLISQVEWNYFSHDYVWSEANERMYHFRDDTSPNDIIWEIIDLETGIIGAQQDSPLHSSVGMIHPIRVHPDGLIVLLGSGRYHDAISLELLEELGTDLVDGRWFANQLVTLHDVGGNSELRTWNDFLTTVIETQQVEGAPLRVLEDKGVKWVVTDVDGVPTIRSLEGEIFADGFESGDTSVWAVTQP